MRSEDLVRVQFGLEAQGAKGTTVAANRYLSCVEEFTPGINLSIGSEGRPKGSKYAEAVLPGREFVESDFEGMLSYSQIVYLLQSALKRIAPPAPGAQAEGVWTWAVDRWTNEDPQAFTVESGDGTDSSRFNYGLVPDLTLEFGIDDNRFSGRMIGTKFTEGIGALTAAPTTPELVPVLSTQTNLYIDSVAANIGTTKVAESRGSSFSISDHWEGKFVQNSANGRDFVAHLERRPAVNLGLRMAKGTVSNAFLTDARNGTKKFVRLEAVGGLIGGAINYRLRVDAAGFLIDWPTTEDDDGMTVQPFSLIPTHDATLGKAFSVEAINKITSANV